MSRHIPRNPASPLSVEFPPLLAGHSAVAAGPIPIEGILGALLVASGMLFLWRIALRMVLTASAYGWREGLRALPRVIVANAIAIMAARRALARYLGKRDLGWNKTDHAFPAEVPAE